MPCTTVSAEPANTEDGYQAALDFLMASNSHAGGTRTAGSNVIQVQVDPNILEGGQLGVKDGTEFEMIGFTEKGKKQFRCCLCNTLTLDPNAHKLLHSEERPFLCDFDGCGKSYKSRPALKQHIMCHHTMAIPHHCLKCGKNFKTEYLLKKHVSITCNDTRPYLCRTCAKPFKTISNLRYHEGTHATVKPFQCVDCGKTMASKAHLNVHMASHEEGNYVCFCGKRYKNSKRYKEHFKFVHDLTNPNRCDICNKNFKNAGALMYHKETHSRPVQCRFCKKGFFKAVNCHNHEIQQHKDEMKSVQEHIGENVKCRECEKVFKSERAMLAHWDTHSMDYKFACEVCGKKFKVKRDVQSHMFSHVEATVACPKCNKMFKDDKAVQVHMLSHLKPHECQQCGARYSCLKYLRKHEEYHAKGIKLKTYACPWCKLVFPSLSNIKMHVEDVHPEQAKKDKVLLKSILSTGVSFEKNPSSAQKPEEPKIFNCELCNVAFSTESGLITHEMKSHHNPNTKMACSECNVKFLTPRTLKKHQYNVHQIGDLYSCDICAREFFKELDWAIHLNVVHADSKKPLEQTWVSSPMQSSKTNMGMLLKGKQQLFICIVCSKYLPTQSALVEHEQSHKQEEIVCKICSNLFQSLSELKEHGKICSNTKCIYCCQEFKTKSDLEKHKKFHLLGKVVYKCTLCNKDFSSGVDLRQHKQQDHIDNKNGETDDKKTFKSLLSSFGK